MAIETSQVEQTDLVLGLMERTIRLRKSHDALRKSHDALEQESNALREHLARPARHRWPVKVQAYIAWIAFATVAVLLLLLYLGVIA
jgi:hypothetical protein